MDVYRNRHFYNTIVNFGKAELHLAKHLKVHEVANFLEEIVHIKDKLSSYPFGERVTRSDRFISAENYKPTLDCMEHITKHEAVKEKAEVILKNSSREDAQLPTMFKDRRPTLPKMLAKRKSM